MKEHFTQQLERVLSTPSAEAVSASRRRIEGWFADAAPLLRWDVMQSPLGAIHIALSGRGLCQLEIGLSDVEFISRLDPFARSSRDSGALAGIAAQLGDYFAGQRRSFDIALDFDRLPAFQRSVLNAIHAIPAGTMWSYQQVAQAIGRPTASRAVGQALNANPVPIVAPCHRVIASNGDLRGYKSGIENKRWLLELEGAL